MVEAVAEEEAGRVVVVRAVVAAAAVAMDLAEAVKVGRRG